MKTLPGTVSGILWADQLREEATTKADDRWSTKFGFFRKLWLLWNKTPSTAFQTDSITYVTTHLQKKARWGILRTRPFGFHIFVFWKPQEYRSVWHESRSEWVSGTERGIYIRLPGYRWDFDLGMIWTWGRIGGTWD